MPGSTIQTTKEELEIRFRYHPPSQEQTVTYSELRTDFLELAHVINNRCPEGREKALALTHLESALFYANAAIARRS